MHGFFHLKSADPRDQKTVGDAIIRVMRTALQDTPGSEWKKLKDDPHGWLHGVGYVYKGAGASADGKAPATLNITVVCDSADTMYVRIPWKGELENIPNNIVQDAGYGTLPPAERFPVLLARYFMRKCR